jgi:DnaJ-domain-containing protein 1
MTDDPFDILGLPATFDVNPAELRAAFLAKSGTLHPDVAGHDDPEALARSAALNKAKRVLADPETRAEALLARLGGPAKDQDRSLPPAFLQEMMETREEIDAAIASGDPGEVVKWERWAEERRQGHIESVARQFRELINPPAPADSGRLRAIRMELNMWRYVQRLIEQLADAEGASR